MQDELRETHFGALVVGTGLAQSIVAAALSAASQPIIHIDEHAAYGGPHASLSLNELRDWAGIHGEYVQIDDSLVSRQYTLSLVPQLVPATGPFVAALVNSGVARYGSFVMPKRVVVATPTDTPDLAPDGGASGAEPVYQFRTVPANKQDVFRDKSVSLVQKRRLIKFLVFASGEFEGSEEVRGKESTPLVEFLQSVFQLEPDLADALAYATAFCANSNDPTLPALKRTRAYLRSVGRYGPSPFLMGHYGGAGELAQGFCRTCAVGGGTYVLGRKVLSIVRSDGVEADTAPATETETETASAEEREQTHRERTTSTGIKVQTYHPPATFEGYGVEGVAAPSTDQSAAEATGPASEPKEPASTAEKPEPAQPTPTGPFFRIQLEDFAAPFTASTLVGPQHWLARIIDGVDQPAQPTHTVRAVLVIDSIALDKSGELDETLVVFPPKGEGAAVTVLGHGSSTMSCPDGKCVLYFTTQSPALDESPKAHLQPYVDAIVRGNKVWAEVFWRENEEEKVVVRKAARDQPYAPVEQEYTTMHLTEGADAAACEAEHVFWQVLGETPGEDGKGPSGVEFFARVGRQEDMDDFD